MADVVDKITLSSDRLFEIIKFQTEIVQQGLDLYDVMYRVALCSEVMTGAQGAAVELAEGDEMVYHAATGIAEAQLGLRLKRDSSLSGFCIGTGGPLFCEDSETDPRVDRNACRRVGLRSMIVVPLEHRETVAGVLKVMATEVNVFNASDVEVLKVMSQLIAAAMSNASLYQSGEIYHRATHDALTDLYNRAHFYHHLQERVAQTQRCAARFGVLALDMDNLKHINDTFGHNAGDAAIKEFADRIKSASRATDTVARLGGDEFAILLHKVPHRAEAQAAIDRILNAVALPFSFQDQPLPLAGSIGVAIYPDDGTDIHVLMEKADAAMYEMKRRHKEQRKQTITDSPISQTAAAAQ